MFERLGKRFTLLALDADEATVAAFERAAGALAVPLEVIRDSCRDGRTAYGSRLVLVRPDQHVAWAGDAEPPRPAALLGRAVGRA